MAANIYLDHASTTSVRPEAMEKFLEISKNIGNASSIHSNGRLARKIVEEAREEIAFAVGAKPSEIIFTSSGTESDNFAIKGLYWQQNKSQKKPIVLISAFEHHAILEPAHWLAEFQGAEVIEIPILKSGFVDLDFIQKIVGARANEIALVSVIHGHNELGTIQPISEIKELIGNIPFHTDCVQSLGKVKIDFNSIGADAATFTSHKIGGVPGTAAFFLKQDQLITPLLHGGGQEREVRSGTFNVPGIAAFATAVSLAVNEIESHRKYLKGLREKLFNGIKDIEGIAFNAAGDLTAADISEKYLLNILNLTFTQVESEALLMVLDNLGFSLSAGSACTAGVARPSYVLTAMGFDEATADSALRVSISQQTTEAEIELLIAKLPDAVARARSAYKSRHR
jgi:cysteine desulfurase